MFRYWIVFSLLFSWNSAFAVEVSDLYTAKVALNSQTQRDQSSALKAALKAVLVKIAGDEKVLSNAFIKNEVQHYSKYLTQFNYLTDNGVNNLVASFDENKINQLFFQENLPLWGKLRPLVLFWVVTEDGLKRRIISETDESPLHDEISALATEKGLPVILPLMDLTDTQNIQIPDLWGRFIDPIKLASQRYTPESVVIIRVSKNAIFTTDEEPTTNCDLLCKQSAISIDWHIVTTQSDKVETGNQYKGVDELVLMKTVMSDITTHISQRYSLTTETDHDLIIDVANVDSLAQYVDVTQFLDKLSVISSFKLIKAQGNNRRFQLTLMGSADTLFASLKLNNKLKQYVDPLLGQNADDIPVFFWGTE
ncbi:DUF2066 domain-containing protein [Colwellia sp. UCD-KL20]|uniref:DUF2066 domain-containing protein n=1 Tax=Colwellia sp. UCD-KL20 TaxID=1917165 RepID=UPI0009712C76|nr:DUF2066 domain-containing protein [Colwellia sp. UCD-KL20]